MSSYWIILVETNICFKKKNLILKDKRKCYVEKQYWTDKQMESTINSYYSDSPSKEGPSIKKNSKLRVLHISIFLHHQDF